MAIFCFFSVAIVSTSSSEVIGRLVGRSFFLFVGGGAGRAFDKDFFLFESSFTIDGSADLVLCFKGAFDWLDVFCLDSFFEEVFPGRVDC